MPGDENSFFAQLFNSIQSFVALFNPGQRKLIEVNRFGIEMFGVQDKNEFVSCLQSGRLWPEPPSDLQAYFTGLELIVSQTGYLEKEMLYQTVSGKPFWGILRIDTLGIEGEKHFLIKITNIDGFKKAELKAGRDAQQLEALFHNSTIGVIITNHEGQIINFNEFAENQFGYLKEEVLGHPVELLIPQTFHNRHKAYRDSFVHHPQNRIMGAGRDLFARRKDNSEFPVEISLSSYSIENLNYVIAFVIDIAIRKKNELLVLSQRDELEKISAQLSQLNAGLERKVEDRTQMLKDTLRELELSKNELSTALEKEKELGELKSRFVTMASHEFRTPLSTILSSCYIVQQYTSAEDQDKRNKHLLKIQTAVQNLTFILEDFLSLEKLEKGLVQVKLGILSEQDLIAEIESSLEELGQMLKRGQKFRFRHAELAAITTDKKLLRNILLNLISNAIKYSHEYSTIEVECVAEKGRLRISVTDQGIGIPEEEQKHLFERFFRATNAAETQGTGLGLHIVNRYLKLIKGDIELKSQLNIGTTFTVLLRTNNAEG